MSLRASRVIKIENIFNSQNVFAVSARRKKIEQALMLKQHFPHPPSFIVFILLKIFNEKRDEAIE